MASGPATKPAAPVTDWQSVNDWQDVNASAPAAPEKPGLFQTMKNNFNAGTQHPAPPTGIMDALSPKRALQNFGAGAGDAIRGTYHMFDSKPKLSLDQQYDQAGQQVENFAKDPVGAYASAAGQVAPAMLAGGLTHGAIDALPSTSRAGANLSAIEQKATNTPVNFNNTRPALQDFDQHVATGGKGAPVMTKLNDRIQPPNAPVNFPEARQFYSNVSDVTKRPGFLRRAMEDSNEPRLRAAAGPVRAGMNADLTESLKPLNLDEDYNAALKEYAQGKMLKTGLKRAGIAGAGAAAGSMGLGKLHGIASSVLR